MKEVVARHTDRECHALLAGVSQILAQSEAVKCDGLAVRQLGRKRQRRVWWIRRTLLRIIECQGKKRSKEVDGDRA